MDSLLTAVKLTLIGLGLSGLFYLCGAGVTKLLIPSRLKSNEILISPIIGIAVFVILSYALSFSGLGAAVWIWIVIAIGVGIYIAAGFKTGWRITFSSKEHLLPLVLALGVFIIGVAPLAEAGFLTNIGTNGDVINYCLPADYLINHGLGTAAAIAPTSPLTAINHIWFPLGARLGTNLLVAGAASLFSLESYQVFFPLINFLMAAAILSVWVLCRNGLRLGLTASRLSIAALAAGNIIYWGAYDGFLAQQLMICLLPGLAAVGFVLIDEPAARTAGLAAVLFSPIIASYEFALVYPAIALGAYLIIRAVQARSLRQFIKPFLIFGVSTLLINTPVFIRRGFSFNDSAASPEFASSVARSVSGNIRYYTPVSDLLGLNVHQHTRAVPPEGILAMLPLYSVTVGLILGAALIFFAYGLYRATPDTRWKVISMLAPFIIVAGIMRYLTFPYAYYKNIAISQPFVLIALCFGISMAAGKISPSSGQRRAALRWVSVIFAVCFFGLNLGNLAFREAYIIYKINQTNSEIITPSADLIALNSEIPKTPGSLMIGGNIPDTQQLWMFRFLQNRDLKIESPSGYLGKYKDSFREKSDSDFAIYAAGYKIGADKRWNPSPVWRNGSYLLYQRAR